MIHYVIQVIIFQVLFLITYDLFFKKETFFNWSRAYLLITPILSFILPFIKLEAFKEVIPTEYIIQLPEIIVGNQEQGFTNNSFQWSWWQLLFIVGSLFSLFILAVKLYRLLKIRNTNAKIKKSGYTAIIIKNSTAAFSFFKTIFLGEKITHKKHDHIIEHELVHIKQLHSVDLMFFEFLRIIMWFNPLIYIYQSRIAAVHEFIADKITTKDKSNYYQHLLSEVFKTEDISFINQFFKTSLIKKRIVMLQKSKSKKIWQLKYLLLIPLLAGMLIYSSCENQNDSEFTNAEVQQRAELEDAIISLKNELNNKSLSNEDKEKLLRENFKLMQALEEVSAIYKNSTSYTTEIEKKGFSLKEFKGGIPFAVVGDAPVFPNCEGNVDKRSCFKEQLNKHIKKYFNYPKEAQEKGIQGKVYVQFTIQKDGTIGNIKMRGPHRLLEEETRRIIEKLPKMLPGKHKGEAVDIPFSLPITFKLN